MTTTKAIKILSELQKVSFSTESTAIHFALKLHIEAMKRLILMRSYNIDMAIAPLPGEERIYHNELSLH